ncbi:MAG: hypothetical protein Q4A58_04015 [Fusobacterium sp.]|uniref:hypothetical protein n=1 Tax=Fusobacterium sp. TaxID=68766 RepID=UPI0026DD6269|nr:hypothetical protein [Fusobacterium sp.]MDO4690444.1 hypothetical protein [Fusobacterium sp.]
MIRIMEFNKNNIKEIYCILYPETQNNDDDFWNSLNKEILKNKGLNYNNEFIPLGKYLVRDRYGNALFYDYEVVKKYI